MQLLTNVNTNSPSPKPDYLDFIAAKVKLDTRMGFEVPPGEIFSTLPDDMKKPHQRDIVRWALMGGRRARRQCFTPLDLDELAGCADGPRYKALGNSMAVNVMRWILGRIGAAIRGNK